MIIDGGTGTEMERRGITMDDNGWSAGSVLVGPDVLRQIHIDYIEAGAEMIITNTFSDSRHLLEHCGKADQFEEIHRKAAQIAVEARDAAEADHQVFVACSISEERFGMKEPPAASIRLKNYRDQAEIQAENGADCIQLEMVSTLEGVQIGIEAAQSVGLPVFLGTTVWRREENPSLLVSGEADFDTFCRSLPMDELDMVTIMHTQVENTTPSLDILKHHYDGPLGIYAHSGVFEMPNWRFNDVISPEEYNDVAQEWVDRGIRLLGGCCGIGPEHIRMLKERFG